MKSLFYFCFYLLIGIISPPLLANNPPTTLEVDGKVLPAEHTINGKIDLYTVYFPEEKIVVVNGQVQVRKVYNKLRYCLVIGSEIKVLTPYNYKRMLKRCLPNATYLHRQLGKTGFQYQNIVYMIEYYNSYKVKEQL